MYFLNHTFKALAALVLALVCDSLAGIIITGMENAPLKNISLSNIFVEYRGGGTADMAQKKYREQGTNYPEPRWAGPTPSYGLFARHIEGLKLRDITFALKKGDGRPAVMLENVKNLDMKDVKDAKGEIVKKDSKNI